MTPVTPSPTSFVTFLRPFVRQFPFDETCVQIMDELEARSWQVPGVSVTFHAYGTGEQKFRSVKRIDTEDVTIKFGRQQRLLHGGRFYDTAAAHQIAIPGRLLAVYQGESGPTFYLYVGDNWAHDRQKFIDGGKVNSKLRGEPRTYLTYGPGCDCRRSFKDALKASFDAAQELRHWHTGQRAPLLVCHDDLDREYRPVGDDPTVLRTVDIMTEVDAYLVEHLLTKIQAYPLLRAPTVVDPSPPSAPPPAELGTIFCLGNHRDAKRICAGKVDPSQQHPADRYGMLTEGLRLVPYSSRGDMTIPPNAHDSFLWCGLARDPDDARSAKIFGDELSSRDEHVILVKPRTANQIYIVDHAAYRRRKSELAMSMTMASVMNAPEQVRECMIARGRTILPIADYRGGFEEPIILIGRELGLDEVEVLGRRIDSTDLTDPRSP